MVVGGRREPTSIGHTYREHENSLSHVSNGGFKQVDPRQNNAVSGIGSVFIR